MKNSDDTFPGKSDEAININSKSVEKGDVMESQAGLKSSDSRKEESCVPRSMNERRSVNSDRRIKDGNDYFGPARRMNIDRRE